MATKTYLHGNKMLFVGPGLDGRFWFTYYQRIDQKKRYRRFVSKNLPLREHEQEALNDLDVFAAKKGCQKL